MGAADQYLKIGDLDINDGVNYILDRVYAPLPEPNIDWRDPEHRDGQFLHAYDYQNREIRIVMSVKADTEEELSTAIHALFAELTKPTNVLTWRPYGWEDTVYFDTFLPQGYDSESWAAEFVREWNPHWFPMFEIRVSALPFARGDPRTLQAFEGLGVNDDFTDFSPPETSLYHGGASACRMVADGAGGFFAVFIDAVDEVIKVQHVNSDGMQQWDLDGIEVAEFLGRQGDCWPDIVLDGAGGIVVAWRQYMYGEGHYKFYGQRINVDGELQWGSSGVQVSPDTKNSNSRYMKNIIVVKTSDSFVFVWGAWPDELWYFNSRVWAMRTDMDGVLQWPTEVSLSDEVYFDEETKYLIDDALALENDDVEVRFASDWPSRVRFQRITPDGTLKYGSEGKRMPDCYGQKRIYGRPMIAQGPNPDEAVHVYMKLNEGGINYYALYADCFDTDGNSVWGGEREIWEYFGYPNDKFDVARVVRTTDNYYVAYVEKPYGIYLPWQFEIGAQKFNSNGTTQWADLLDAGHFHIQHHDQNHLADVMATSDGGSASVSRRDGSRYWLSKLDSSGVLQYGNPGIEKLIDESYIGPHLCSDAAGGVETAWYYDGAILKQRYDPTGTSLWTGAGEIFGWDITLVGAGTIDKEIVDTWHNEVAAKIDRPGAADEVIFLEDTFVTIEADAEQDFKCRVAIPDYTSGGELGLTFEILAYDSNEVYLDTITLLVDSNWEGTDGEYWDILELQGHKGVVAPDAWPVGTVKIKRMLTFTAGADSIPVCLLDSLYVGKSNYSADNKVGGAMTVLIPPEDIPGEVPALMEVYLDKVYFQPELIALGQKEYNRDFVGVHEPTDGDSAGASNVMLFQDFQVFDVDPADLVVGTVEFPLVGHEGTYAVGALVTIAGGMPVGDGLVLEASLVTDAGVVTDVRTFNIASLGNPDGNWLNPMFNADNFGAVPVPSHAVSDNANKELLRQRWVLKVPDTYDDAVDFHTDFLIKVPTDIASTLIGGLTDEEHLIVDCRSDFQKILKSLDGSIESAANLPFDKYTRNLNFKADPNGICLVLHALYNNGGSKDLRSVLDMKIRWTSLYLMVGDK